MNNVSRLLLNVALPSALAFAAAHVAAAPVAVSVSAFSFAPASGYGVDANENVGTLLDVVFSNGAFSAQSFLLNAAGDSATFAVGTVQFREPNSMGGIRASETDHLDVAASFTLTHPLGTLVPMTATGTAVTGAVSDSAIDLTIDWHPVQLGYGAGGLLEFSLNKLEFTGLQTLSQSATVTLLNAPVSAVPEPGSLVLAGLGLAGLGLVRGRRANASGARNPA